MDNETGAAMPATKTRPSTRRAALIEPPAPDVRRVYMSYGVNLTWRAKRAEDGAIVAEHENKRDAMHEAERLGYIIN